MTTMPTSLDVVALWEALASHPQVLLMNVSSCHMLGDDGPTISVALLVQQNGSQRHCYVPQVSGPQALAKALSRAALFVEWPQEAKEASVCH